MGGDYGMIKTIPSITKYKKSNLIVSLYNYCLWIETLLYGNFAKIIMIPYNEFLNMASPQLKMLMRQEDSSTILYRIDGLSSDETSFIKEMGKITGENMHCEQSIGRYKPMKCAESHENFINAISTNDPRIAQLGINYTLTQDGLHEKNEGVTSSQSCIEINLTDAPIASLIISNRDKGTGKYFTSTIAVSFNKDNSKIFQLYQKDKDQIALGICVISTMDFTDKLPDKIRVYLNTDMKGISLIVTDLSNQTIKTLRINYEVADYLPINRVRNSLQVSIGYVSTKNVAKSPVTYFIMRLYYDAAFEYNHASAVLIMGKRKLGIATIEDEKIGLVETASVSQSKMITDFERPTIMQQTTSALYSNLSTTVVRVKAANIDPNVPDTPHESYNASINEVLAKYINVRSVGNNNLDVKQFSQNLGNLPLKQNSGYCQLWSSNTYTIPFETANTPDGFILHPSIGENRTSLFIGTSFKIVKEENGAMTEGVSGALFTAIWSNDLQEIILIGTVSTTMKSFVIGSYPTKMPHSNSIVFRLISGNLYYMIDYEPGNVNKSTINVVQTQGMEVVMESHMLVIEGFMDILMSNEFGHQLISGYYIPPPTIPNTKSRIIMPSFFYIASLLQTKLIKLDCNAAFKTVAVSGPTITPLANGGTSRHEYIVTNGRVYNLTKTSI